VEEHTTTNYSGGPHFWSCQSPEGASKIEGSGLHAAEPIRSGDTVFVWGGGSIISDAELHAIAASRRRYNCAATGENQHILWAADDQARAYYERERASGKSHWAALRCLARQLCRVVFSMLVANRPYRPATNPSTPH